MLIRDIISKKGTRVLTVPPGTTVREATRTMVENKVGAVLVTEGAQVLGIFTERDNMKLTARGPVKPDELLVDDVMSKDLVVGLPGDSVEQAMGAMTEKRVRHLPVISDGLLVGIVSIGDVVKAVADQHKVEIHFLKNYISGAIS